VQLFTAWQTLPVETELGQSIRPTGRALLEQRVALEQALRGNQELAISKWARYLRVSVNYLQWANPCQYSARPPWCQSTNSSG